MAWFCVIDAEYESVLQFIYAGGQMMEEYDEVQVRGIVLHSLMYVTILSS
jgi:hypothetical protein